MGWDSPDLYHQPEAFGLTLVGSVDWTRESYQFDFTIVLEGVDEQGVVYYLATDAGCSCPSPFESVNALADADFTTRDPRAVVTELRRMLGERHLDEREKADAAEEILELSTKLMRRT